MPVIGCKIPFPPVPCEALPYALWCRSNNKRVRFRQLSAYSLNMLILRIERKVQYIRLCPVLVPVKTAIP